MNREIIFRGKRVDNGTWVECKTLIQMWIDGREIIQLEHSDSNEFRQYDVIPETIGQFTGLLDKNDKKIFDGDIIKTNEQISIIKYNSEIGCFTGLQFVRQRFNQAQTEIIGNIHDNQELLNVKQ